MNKTSLHGKKVAILGFGLEGQDLFEYLLQEKAIITVYDKKPVEELEIEKKYLENINVISGVKYLQNGLKDYDIIFRSPGVYRFLPEIVEAEKAGVLISSSIKLFMSLCKGKIIGVTGTKGKGTTATLIYKILRKDNKDVFLAGNIGNPALKLLPKINRDNWVVLELSSFQLIDLEVSPHISVVLNITTDHLDWHKNRKEYVYAKTNIIAHQEKANYAVINFDYKTPKSFEKLTKARIYYFSKKHSVKGAYVKDKKIYLNIGKKRHIGDTKNLKLKGQHNWENVCAGVCSSYLAGAKLQSIKNIVFSFKGLEHRLEFVRKVKNVSFYNDSFSTNPQTTIAAVRSFNEPITLILGGYDKKLDYTGMAKEIKRSSVTNIVLIGDIAMKLEKAIIDAEYDGNIINLDKSSMNNIVKKCLEVTPRNGVVLLSPATSSFDMFESYKDRGLRFKDAVNKLG
jgi:UDP-N-acetylmuramoylalanine--D-glutamate ligase